MLEVTPSLPLLAPPAPPPASAATAPDAFALALADASAGVAAASDRQDLAAPGKTLPAGLTGLVVGDAKPGQTPVSRVLVAKPGLADPDDQPLTPGDGVRPDDAAINEGVAVADDDTPTAVSPQYLLSGYGTLVLPPPVAPPTAASAGPAITAPIAKSIPLTQPTPTDKAPTPAADGTAPKAAPLTDPPVSRRLSLKLDPSIEVVDAGRPARATPASHTSDARPSLRFAAAALPPPTPLASPAAAVAASGVAQPAVHAFARAISQALVRPVRSDPAGDITDIGTAAQAIAAADARPVVLAPRALDTTREDWPQRLIDRAEAARDAANAADTRIRLVPESLGKIDIALRQDGATLHVHFTADQSATRDLLQQAQPRLAELAEARGLRLGQSGVDGGGDQPRRPPVAPAPVANRPATAFAAERRPPSGDRIA